MLSLHARFSDTTGKGVGRWRLMYAGAEDIREARWRAQHIVPSAQVRVLEGRRVIAGPMRADAFARGEEA